VKKITLYMFGILILFNYQGILSAYGARYPSEIDIKSPLNAKLTKILGENSGDSAGYSVAGGDINGDGNDDLIIGAYKASDEKGVTYVIFGSGEIFDETSIDLNSISSGVLKIVGKNVLDWSGSSVTVGDINGDAYGDVIIGAYKADPGGRINAGEVYVVFGSSSIYTQGTIDLSGTPSGVVRIYGDDNENWTGYSVAAGDINGDSNYDIIIGACRADPLGRSDAGETYVIYGSSDFHTRDTIDLSGTPSGVTKICGKTASDQSGYSVSAGDFNGDGIDDVVTGAIGYSTNRGRTYVIAGSSTIHTTSTIDINSSPAGLVAIYGDNASDYLGSALAAGDFDGDGCDDLIIGAYKADSDGKIDSGKAYVIFGVTDFQEKDIINLAYENDDVLEIFGIAAYEQSGKSLAVGDFNHDGYDDVVIGAYSATPQDRPNAGTTIIISGEAEIDTLGVIDLFDDQFRVSKIYGANGEDYSGNAVKTGDFNGDGFDDLLIGAYLADPEERNNAGELYILSGINKTRVTSFSPGDLAHVNRYENIYVYFNSDLSSLTMKVIDSEKGIIANTLNWSGSSATFIPNTRFTRGGSVRVEISGENVDEEAIIPISWFFYINEDELPPRLISRSPAKDEINVAPTDNIVVTFSRDIYPDSTIVNIRGADQRIITMSESWEDSTLTLINDNSFQLSEIITVLINAGDLGGDRIEYSWTFGIRPEIDPPSFTVIVDGYPELLHNDASINLFFPSDIDKSSVKTLLIGSVSGVLPGTWTWFNTKYSFTPLNKYRGGETLDLTVSASDIRRNTLSDSTVTFIVRPDEIPPSIISRSPDKDEVGVDPNTDIVIEFTDDVVRDSTTVVVTSKNQGSKSMIESWVDYTLTLLNTSSFQPGDTLTVAVNTGDAYANRQEYTWFFIIRSDITPPYFTVEVPENPDMMGINDPITLVFPGDIDKSSVRVSLKGSLNDTISGSWSWSNSSYTFTPTYGYPLGYQLILIVNASDIYGNSIPETTHNFSVKPDENPPMIFSHLPYAYEKNVPVDENVVIQFSSDVFPDSTLVTVKSNTRASIAMNKSWTGSTLKLTNQNSFQQNEIITVSIYACDRYSNFMTYEWSFSTGPESSFAYYKVEVPGNPEMLSLNAPITLVFSCKIDTTNVEVSFEGSLSGQLSGEKTWADTAYTFNPLELYKPGETLMLTVNAADIYKNSFPETIVTFTVGEHNPWLVITSVEPSDSITKKYIINFTTGDMDNSYSKSRCWQYSVDGGEWEDIPENQITDNISQPPGQYSIYWILPNTFTGFYSDNVRFRMEMYDGQFGSGYQISPPFIIDWNQPPSVNVTNVIPNYADSTLKVTYSISDVENNPVSLFYEYSSDCGTTWFTGTPVNDLSSIPSNKYSGSLEWNYLEGLESGIDYFRFLIRLTPFDYKAGISSISDTINVDLNIPPSVELENIYTPQSGDITIYYHITDAESDTIRFACSYSLNGGETWIGTQNVSGADSILASDGSIVWFSKLDIPSIETFSMQLRMIPWDHDEGKGDIIEAIQLLNNSPPTVTVSLPDTVGNIISIPYLIADQENDLVDLHVMWSHDGKVWNPLTDIEDNLAIEQNAYIGTLMWNSKTDIGEGYFEEIVLRVAATDKKNLLGSSAINYSDNLLTLDNESPFFASAWGLTGSNKIYFNFTETLKDAIVLDAEKYSLSSGLKVKSVHGGVDRHTYYILLDENKTLPFADITITGINIEDKFENGAEEITITFSPDINEIPKITIKDIPVEVSGDVAISFQISDKENDTVSLEVFFSIDGGIIWNNATVTGTITDLDAENYSGTFTWNSSSDLGSVEIQDVLFKIIPKDIQEGMPAVSNFFRVDNNIPPSVEISVADPDSVYTGNVEIFYNLSDVEKDTLSVSGFYSLDDGKNYQPATVTGFLTNIDQDKYTGKLIWNTDANLSDYIGMAMFKLVPFDKEPGAADSISVWIGVCRVIVTLPVGEQAGNITVAYHITDPNGRDVNLAVEYSLDSGQTWESATTEDELSKIKYEEYEGSFVWKTENDIKGYDGIVLLRVIPNNGIDGFPDSGEVIVDCNEPPYVEFISNDLSKVYSGQLIVSFSASDSEKDTLNVYIEYSLDGGNTYNPANVSDGTIVIPDADTEITWFSFDDVGYIYNQKVYLRLIPYDKDQGAPFDAGPFTITNLAGDYTYDLKIDGEDIIYFVDAWNMQDTSKEIGPATGTPPDLTVEPDGKVDFEDLAVFIWMWNWYTEHGAVEEFKVIKPALSSSNEQVSNTNIYVVPSGDGTISLFCDSRPDYVNMIVESKSDEGTEISIKDNDYWTSDNNGIFLTRLYNNRIFEVACARLGDAGEQTFESYHLGTINIKNNVGDIYLVYKFRLFGEKKIYEGETIILGTDLFRIPAEFALMQNAPNPFNSSTAIEYSLPKDTHVRLTVYNITGQVVTVLEDKMSKAGNYSVTWNAKNMPSGIYLYTLKADDFIKTKKMLLLK